MHTPPDPRARSPPNQPSWREILVGYAMVAAILPSLWIVSHPVAGSAVLAVAVGLFVGARRALALVRCFHDCRGFAVDLAGRVRVTITPTPADDCNATA